MPSPWLGSLSSVIWGYIYGLRDCESFLELFNGVIDYMTGAVQRFNESWPGKSYTFHNYVEFNISLHFETQARMVLGNTKLRKDAFLAKNIAATCLHMLKLHMGSEANDTRKLARKRPKNSRPPVSILAGAVMQE